MGQVNRLRDDSKHSFSIELESSQQLSGISLPFKQQRVLIEGSLGKLLQISLVESLMLEVECSGGTLRIDLTEEEYMRAMKLGTRACTKPLLVPERMKRPQLTLRTQSHEGTQSPPGFNAQMYSGR